MTTIDDDLAPEKIGWLRAFENSKIEDEEPEEQPTDKSATPPDKQPTRPASPVSETKAAQNPSLPEQLKQAATQPTTEEQATFDNLIPDFFPKKTLTHYDYEDTQKIPRACGWHTKRGRER